MLKVIVLARFYDHDEIFKDYLTNFIVCSGDIKQN